MPTIDKRVHPSGKVTYRVRVRLRGMPSYTKTFKTKTEAKAWGQRREAAIRDGNKFPDTKARKRTLNDLIEKYIREVLPSKPKSLKKQTMQLKWWQSQVGDRLLIEVAPSLLAEQRDKLLSETLSKGTRRSPSTVNRYIAAMSRAFTVARKEWQWLKENPFSQIFRPKEPRGRDRYLSKDEIEALLLACSQSRNKWLYTIVKLGICTGLRKGEILGLKWDDISFEEMRITIKESKNQEMHILPMSQTVFTLLMNHKAEKRQGCSFVFPSKDNRKPADIRGAWEHAIKFAEIENCRFHDLRRTFASFLASSGCSTLEIGRLLNHKTLAMVRRYSFHSNQSLSHTLNEMNNKLFGEINVQKT